jgi:hypothetical protein
MRIEAKVKKMKQYEEFLERVKELNSDDFSELKEILLRYNTLKESHETLKKTQKTTQSELDLVNTKMIAKQKEKNTQIMSLNNEIATQQKKFELIEDKKSKL